VFPLLFGIALANLSAGGCLPRGVLLTYISHKLYPIFSAHLPPSPTLTVPVPSWIYLNMDAIKGFLAPLHLNSGPIQDTLVRMFRSSPGKWSELFLLETICQRRYGRGSAEGLSIRMGCIYRLFVSSLEVMRLSKGQLLAFYLTAHFSREDHPYDWQVVSSPSCARTHALASAG
jgi:hypothetical protein